MATAPTSYYTAYSNMAQQTWTPVAHPANTYGNSLPWTNAATTGSGAAAANQECGYPENRTNLWIWFAELRKANRPSQRTGRNR